MSQHDFSIDNQSAPAFRGDLNNALEALATLSSGATAPATTYANMLWYDTANNILYMRSEADDAWISLGTLDQSTNTFSPAGLTNLSQVQVENAASTLFGQVSGERLAQAVAAFETPQTSPTTNQVLSATAGATFGAVGTYAFLYSGNNVSIIEGGTYAGSGLFPAGIWNEGSIISADAESGTSVSATRGGTSVSGTWRAMGRINVSSGITSDTRITLYLRIS